MDIPLADLMTAKPVHPWLRRINMAYVPGSSSPIVDEFASDLLDQFHKMGHTAQDIPDNNTNIIFTSATFGEPLSWRKAMLFTARRRFKLKNLPTIYSIIHATPQQFDEKINHFAQALEKETPNPDDFLFPGLSPISHRVLVEQGLRGGPILSLMRLLQAQSKCIRILLLVGEQKPERVYHFDLVGAYPYSEASEMGFYEDVVLRIVTTESTREITDHEVVGEKISYDKWRVLKSPEAMRQAGQELGKRTFFTEMIRIQDLVHVPAVGDAVASQYSEGCFATWDAQLGALVTTVTGSARPVDKENITEDELAVIVGVRPDGSGSQIRQVDGKRNDPPSSEAVEMMAMDTTLPRIKLGEMWGEIAGSEVPVIRSKLHGHRGVRAYDPAVVEFVPLDEAFYHYLVSCATEAQAVGIKAAFSRAVCFNDLDDPRKLAFTVLPGHGVVMAEKWIAGTKPFQIMWEYMDSGALEIAKHVPQGVMIYAAGPNGRKILQEQ